MDNAETGSKTEDRGAGTANNGAGGGQVSQIPIDPAFLQSEKWIPVLQQLTSPNTPGQTVTLANQINVTVTDPVTKEPSLPSTLKQKVKAAKLIFVENRGYKFALGALEDQGHVVIAGSPGSGKSTMALYLMHKFDGMKYKLKFVKKIRDFIPEKDIDFHCPTLLVFDDVFHHTNTSLDYQYAFEDIEDYFRAETGRLNTFSKSKESKDGNSDRNRIEFPLKVVFTTRTSSLREVSSQISRFKNLFKPCSVVDLTLSAKLNRDEKRAILMKHLEQHDITLTDDEIDMIADEEYSTLGFPYICRLFVENVNRWKSAIEFFKEPLVYLNECIKMMFNSPESIHTAAVLLLMLLYDGKLDLSRITDVSNYKPGEVEQLYSRLTEVISGLNRGDFLMQIKREAKNQVHTLLTNEGDVVKFSHPTIHDAVAFVVGSKDPTFVLRYCSLTFITERVRAANQYDKQLSSGNEYDYTIDLQKQSVVILVERLAKEVAKDTFALALSHPCLREKEYANHLLGEISTKCPLKDVLHRTDGKYGLCFLFWVALACNNVLFTLVLKEHFEIQEVAEASLGCCMSGNLEGIKILLEQYCSDTCIIEKIKSISLRDILPKHEQTKHTYHRLTSFYDSFSKRVNQSDIEATRMHGENRDKLIHIAAANGHSDIVTILLEHRVDIDTKGGTGMTALMYACYHGCEELVDNLIAKGANTDLLDDEDDNCLHLASRAGFKGVVNILLESGMGINSRGYHWRTPLMFASQYGKYDVVKRLLENGAETKPDSVRHLKDTCIHLAAGNGYTDIVKELIELGKMHIEITGERNRTALMCACRHGHLETAQYLANIKKADILAVDVDTFTCLHLAALGGHNETLTWLLSLNIFDINVSNIFMRTPLMYAMQRANLETVQLLLKSGANINRKDTKGNTCLHLAARSGLSLLIAKCIKQGLDITQCNNTGDTCFHTACSQGCLDIVMYLHKNYNAKTDINKSGFRGKTPLMLACSFGHREIVEYLITSGANVKLTDEFGQFCSHSACYSGKIEIVHVLQKHEIFNLTDVDNEGMTPFLQAVKSDSTEVIDYLMDLNPSVKDATNNAGDSSLHMACWNGSLAAVKKLLQTGVSLSLRNLSGNTCFHIACSRGHIKIVEYLHLQCKDEIDVNQNGECRRRPLHMASFFGHEDVVKYLLDIAGADHRLTDENGRTSFSVACYRGYTGVVRILHEHDTSAFDEQAVALFLVAVKFDNAHTINYLLQMKPCLRSNIFDRGQNALHIACFYGATNSVAKVIQAGTDVNTQDNQMRTPLMLAVCNQNSKVDIVRYLVQEDADFNLTNKHGLTCLHTAVKELGHTSMTEALLDMGMDVNIRNSGGETAIMLACRRNATEYVEVLLRKGADVNFVNNSGQSAMHLACMNREEDINILTQLLEKDHTNINMPDMCGKTPIMYAVSNGKEKSITLLIRNYADPTMQKHEIFNLTDVDNEGMTPFLQAVKSESTEVIDYLMNLDPKVKDATNNAGDSSLHMACWNGSLAAVKKLLQIGVSLSLRNLSGNTCFHIACSRGHIKIVEYLHLQCKDEIDVNQYGECRRRPLHMASFFGHEDVVKYLLDIAGADHRLTDENGRTSFNVACYRGYTGVVRILHEHDTSAFDEQAVALFLVAVKFDNAHTINYLLQMKPCLRSKIFDIGQNALHIACFYGATNSVAKVIQAGTDVNTQDNQMRTPLMLAVCNQNSKVDIVRYLVQEDADFNLTNKHGLTCLHTAVKELGHTSMTEALLDMGMDVNIRNSSGETAIMLACSRNATEYVEVLLRKGADVNFVNNSGQSAMHLACMNREEDINILTQLLEKDHTNINMPDMCGKTPIMYAVSNGKEKSITLLIRNYADPTMRGRNGFSTLHRACGKESANTNIIRILIANGVDVNSRNQYRQTPLMLAAQYGQDEAAEILFRNRANLALVDKQHKNCIYYAESSGHKHMSNMLRRWYHQEW